MKMIKKENYDRNRKTTDYQPCVTSVEDKQSYNRATDLSLIHIQMCIRDRATPEQIRSSFDAEIAFLMTFFKMSIDSRVINAAVYANIVHQADVEILIRKRST